MQYQFTAKPFWQQKLPAWKPFFTLKDAFIFFMVVGVLFIAIGLGMFFTSESVAEHIEAYTDCSKTSTTTPCHTETANASFTKNFLTCPCEISFELKEKFEVCFYRL